MQNIHLIISYDGSKFLGYQIQNEGRTVQKCLQDALEIINKEKIKVDASGRTDRGVHAYEQHCAFKTKLDLDETKWKKAINSLLPDDIYVKEVKKEDELFHPRFSVENKTYLYKINIGDYNPLSRDYIYQLNKTLDIQKMKEASKLFIGEHDFRNFCSNDEIEGFSFVRNISSIEFIKLDDTLEIFCIGNGFMRYMVRNIIGSLIEIGLNKKDISIITSRLDVENRDIIPYCAPSCGLYLYKVNY